MALTGMKFCKPPVVDTKKQSSRPIFQPLRLLSSSANTMHQTKTHDFPFVPLTGHKLVDDPCIPPSFDIMDDHTNFDGDFGFVKNNNFTNARAIFKNASFKGCHQFPMISISQLVGGFVGSKSQVRAKNREPHQIWDIVFQKLDEFVNSRPVERYSEHCYEFQTLSQNFIGSLYEESSSALGIAASYILADGGKSFKNTNPTSNIVKSSPIQQSVEIIPPPVNTFVSHSPVLPSHSHSNSSTVPVLLNFVGHLISQSDLPLRDPIIPDTVRFTSVDHSVSPTSTLDPSPLYDTLAEPPPNKDTFLEKPSATSSEVKQSYAEVAKMAHGRSSIDGDHRQTRMKSSSKRYRKVDNHYFVRSCNDSRQRCVDSSNWREKGAVSSERKDLRRDYFTPAHVSWKCEGKSESVPKRMSQGQWRKNGLKHMKPCTALKMVPEFIPSPAREVVHQADSLSCCQSSPTVRENPCQFYNPNKKSCANWRCRQHCQKSSAKRNVRHILMDNVVVGINLYEQLPNYDESPSPNKNGDIRINTFESYITMPPPVRPSLDNLDGSTAATRRRCKSKSSLPSIGMGGETIHLNLLPKDEGVSANVARPRSLSETMDRLVETPRAGKERSSSESSESVPGRPRSVGEDSRTNSLSSSSLSSSSSGSCKLKPISEASLRRRFSSECDSEDSFVIFEGGAECPDYDSDSDGDSDSSTDESGDLESDGDEVDSFCPRVSLVFCVESAESNERLRELNERWDAKQRGNAPRVKIATAGARCKKVVRFAPEPSLATVHRMVRWDYAYRSARCGPWEQMARDRERFHQRVERSEPTLSAVLGAAHRGEVLRRRRAAGRHDVSPPPPEQTARKGMTLMQGCDAF